MSRNDADRDQAASRAPAEPSPTQGQKRGDEQHSGDELGRTGGSTGQRDKNDR
jgi:hypothetical protein